MDILFQIAHTHPIASLFILYFTIGRLSILVVAVSNFIPMTWAVGCIVGVELLQLPVFEYMFDTMYTFLARMHQRMKHIWRRHDTMDVEKKNISDEPGRFIRFFKKQGSLGVGILATLPFKGCGVWSSILLAKLLKTPRVTLYVLVASGTIIGNVGLVVIGVLFHHAAQMIVNSLDSHVSLTTLCEIIS